MIDYSLILSKHYQGKQWSLNGDTYEGLEWLDESPKPTKDELDALWEQTLLSIKIENIKSQAKLLLQQSDWSETPSAQMDLENGQEWIEYRRALRKIVISPSLDSIIPEKPQTIWKLA